MLSNAHLQEFEYACRRILPKLNSADLKKAYAYFLECCGSKTKSKKDAA
jgi:hypothetical protein